MARHHMSAFGTKRTFRRPQPMSAFGVKRTSVAPSPMSAFDHTRPSTCVPLSPLVRNRQSKPNRVRYAVRWTGSTRLFKRGWPSLWRAPWRLGIFAPNQVKAQQASASSTQQDRAASGGSESGGQNSGQDTGQDNTGQDRNTTFHGEPRSNAKSERRYKVSVVTVRILPFRLPVPGAVLY